MGASPCHCVTRLASRCALRLSVPINAAVALAACSRSPDHASAPKSAVPAAAHAGPSPVGTRPTLGANSLPVASLGRKGTLTAFYGNPRQVFVTGTINF